MITPLLKKLNHKAQEIILLNAPEEFQTERDVMRKGGNKVTSLSSTAVGKQKEITFILSFVQTKAEIEKIMNAIHGHLTPDAVVWFAYPKGTSKKYKADINRDHGWESIGKKGYEAVRSVAIDNDWTGLRFRQVSFIKIMKRNTSLAISEKGKARTGKN